mmetsp:Transcript_22866/g.68010  ORF Transcript_22866/g.68010 Transcript_22866/m.68010 type:complete len:220 (+) Transcript_22866:421-1080(+)
MRCVLLATLSSRGCEQGAAALHALPAARSSRGREQAAAARRALSAARSSRGYEQRCSSATCAVSNPPAADDGSNQPADAAQLPDAPLHSTRRRTETCARRYATEQDTPRAPSSLALQCMLLGSRGVTAHRASAAKLQQLTAAWHTDTLCCTDSTAFVLQNSPTPQLQIQAGLVTCWVRWPVAEHLSSASFKSQPTLLWPNLNLSQLDRQSQLEICASRG